MYCVFYYCQWTAVHSLTRSLNICLENLEARKWSRETGAYELWISQQGIVIFEVRFGTFWLVTGFCEGARFSCSCGSENKEREKTHRFWLCNNLKKPCLVRPQVTRENICSQSTTICMLICVPCRSPSIHSSYTFLVLWCNRAAPCKQLTITTKEVVHWLWLQSLDFTDESTHPIPIGGHWTGFSKQPSVSAAVTNVGATSVIYEQQLSTAHSSGSRPTRRMDVNSGALIFYLHSQ